MGILRRGAAALSSSRGKHSPSGGGGDDAAAGPEGADAAPTPPPALASLPSQEASSLATKTSKVLSPKAFRMMLSGGSVTPRARGRRTRDALRSGDGGGDDPSPAGSSGGEDGGGGGGGGHHSAGNRALMSSRAAAMHARTLAAAEAEAAREAGREADGGGGGGGGGSVRSPRLDLVESSDIPEGGIQALLPDRPEPPRVDAAGAAASTGPTGGGGSAVAPADHGLSEHWMIDHAAIALGKTIGHSSFGMVNEGRLNGTKVAVKTIKRDGKGGKGDDVEAFKKEAELNCKLRHPNVVLFMGICVQPAEVCIVTELMARGNVHDLLVEPIKGKSVKLTWKLRLQWAIDTAQGMAYLHSLTPPMIHRDLKTTNLLVDRGMNVKICDFGLSRFQADDKIMSAVGTVQFAAPEVLRHEKYTEKADLFSYGTVLWELHTRRTIFHGMPQIAVYKSVVDGDMPPVGDGCDARYAQLVRDCWRLDASKRPSFRACLDRLSPLWEELPDDE